MKNIVFRCNASKKTGLGHISRCLVLANKFRLNGDRVFFVINRDKIAIEMVENENFKYYFEDDSDIFDFEFDIFIADARNNISKDIIKRLKEKDILTVAIDEPNEYARECDICFYPPHAKIEKSLYKGRVYQGFEYIILRDEFYKNYKKVKNSIPNILVMMGGTDTYHLTLPVVKQLLSLKQNFDISVIVKKEHKNYDHIKNIDPRVKVYSNIKDMAKFLTKIDFGIISFGVSAYELLTMQIPAIHICLDEDHWQASEYFEKNGYAKRYKKDDIKEITYIELDKQIRYMPKNNNIIDAILNKRKSKC